MSAPKNKGGRPGRKPRPGERVPLGLRVTPAMKKVLDGAARRSGRSQSQEAEIRLEISFQLDNMFGDPIFADMLRRLAGMTSLIEARAKRESLDQLRAFRAHLAGWVQLIGEEVGPHASPELASLWTAYEREAMRPVRDEQKLRAAADAYREAEDRLLSEALNIGRTAAGAFSIGKKGA